MGNHHLLNTSSALRPPSPHPMRRREYFLPNPKARLKEQFHEVCRFKHLALRSEEAYWGWVVRLVKYFDSKIHPKDLDGKQLAEFLTHLATVDGVAASTQNQALNALLFLYREVLHLERGGRRSACEGRVIFCPIPRRG